MKVTILLDTSDSFLHDYVSRLIKALEDRGCDVVFCDKADNIRSGDLLFLLGCRTILTLECLKLNKHNLVIHPSKLPKGRGSAALVWKILEGENILYLTLFEASEKVDSGIIYYQGKIEFKGHELCDEIRHTQAVKTLELVLKFVDAYPDVKGVEQTGEATYYPWRSPKDSKLDIDRTIRQQFNLLRVVDNKRYPAFFEYKGQKYIIQIHKEQSFRSSVNDQDVYAEHLNEAR